MRPLTAIRTAWGAALLVAPGAVVRRVPHQRLDRRARAVAHALGGRDLAQAVIVGRHHTRTWVLAGTAVDAAHATSMVALALLAPKRRALALMNATAATAFAVAGAYDARGC